MSLPNLAFVDIETKKISTDTSFDQTMNNGWGKAVAFPFLDPDVEMTKENVFRMELGVGCVYDNDGIRFYTDPIELLLYLLSPAVDAIIGFNTNKFDFCVLLGSIEPPTQEGDKWIFTEGFQESYLSLAAKSIDILAECEKVLSHRISLDQITAALFDTSKAFSGKHWWPMYNSPDIEKRTKAVNYLLRDVLELYKIYGIAHELGQLAYRDQLGNTRKFQIKVPTVNDLK